MAHVAFAPPGKSDPAAHRTIASEPAGESLNDPSAASPSGLPDASPVRDPRPPSPVSSKLRMDTSRPVRLPHAAEATARTTARTRVIRMPKNSTPRRRGRQLRIDERAHVAAGLVAGNRGLEI